MKKIILTVITAALVCSMCGCGNGGGSSQNSSQTSSSASQSALSLSERTKKLLDEVKFPSMVEVNQEKLELYFDVSDGDVTEYSAYICGSGAMPDEFGVFTAKDADTAAKLKASIEKRIESLRKTYADYTPKEMYKLDDSFVNVNGNTVSYAVCADNAKAKDILG
ncbi:MAG TPA: hypothetical protein DEQ68_07090 [Ruminococcaceae bacterium]|nr:hypothetical protein [Oscillospiraceae bacterium]